MHKINEDLQKERDKCSFNIQDLITLIDGGPEKTRERKDRENVMLSKREVFDGVPEEYLSHKERYENAIRNSVVAFSLVRKMQEEGKTSINNYRDVVGGLLGSSVLRDGSPLGLHYIMFMPAILNQGNEEQQEKWLPRAWNCSIIGSYAQTELGHGTFIRGLETTATYDASTKQFVLHSPTLTAYKWWPGGLGQTANYCIVVAQLYTKGQCHGIHSFIIQVRDEETHMPLPGIKIGEIGAKLGLNAVNNGFLGFDNFRIPRTNMLMKHAQVLEDGTYVKSRHSKLNYGAMVFVRVVIVFDMVNYLSKAVTIATRFSAVRRQCQLKAGETECQILDYVTQQHKLFVSIAAAHAFRITANNLWLTFNEVNEQLSEGNLQRLPELHALACCLKAVTTADTAACVERCRLACGGHGYMMSSSLPLTYGLVTAACTYEGENTVLLLQTARFLVKTYQQLDSKALTPTVAYFKSAAAEKFCDSWTNTTEGIIRGFQVVAMRKIAHCVIVMTNRVSKGMTFEDAWNMTSVQLVAAAEAHCRVIIMSTFLEEVKEMSRTISPQLKEVLHQLVELYCIYWALEKLSDLLLYTPISQKEVESLRLWYEETLTKLRPNAVGLVDAFDLRDEMLQSTLGSYDGRVYERLMEEAMKSPLNAEPVNHTFHKYLKPFMQGKL
ncbi:PREDICTED: probable peroxisomal acyl-coenzyme A oxidase 1 isoform X1 [Papilio xuthus]|uniref:Acyl-coenzyme A oxidase n=1 Tax=Papilio xuthus TaxID=66420 RepID=A0AAJ6ZQR5_PAPXU|nr:PREDICTED: probable peroxisomal acyl-coenzyme A oxidase 1 isoform X1 [Papilio xuthus]